MLGLLQPTGDMEKSIALATRGDLRSELWQRLSDPRTYLPGGDKTERRMVLLQWLVMPLVLAGCLLPPPGPHDPPIHVFIAGFVMMGHPLIYALLSSMPKQGGLWQRAWRDLLLTAADITVATLVFYATAARPGYAEVLLYCTVALAATRYPMIRAIGICSLVACLLIFAALLPLHVPPPTLASEIMGLYALTYLIGLLSQAEKAVGQTAAENARLAQTVMQRNRELSTLHSLARGFNSTSSSRDIVRLGLKGLVEALDLTSACVYLVEAERPRLAARTGRRQRETLAMERVRRRDVARAMACGRTVFGDRQPPDLQGTGPAGLVRVSVPLMVRERVAAVVQVDYLDAAMEISQGDLESLEVLCNELAVALENVTLRKEAHRSAILREKNRIAQELHDTVLQMLFSIGLRLQWALDHLPADSVLRDSLAEARHLSARAGAELRGAIYTLRSDTAEVGLVPAIQQLVSAQAERAGWTANVVTTGTMPKLPLVAQNAAHRVVRECLMNAYKYAQATEVVVSLRCTPASLTVVVQDNGVGIPEDVLGTYRHLPDHFGLSSVAEQVEGLGGELMVYNNDEQGAAIRAVIPVASQSSQAA